ncbi:hypothetical protein BDV96DRAFT_571752 [Lophiotrema nucula]|uniref:Uncharacterized protein n=1 Tax=Lophiotrema nucula TaxID=690887 RepID=A0A6A5ZCP8_9PLEO|nr:hypothetical protein BDV96DRAFT_571752 [Lophiotrema nucula]
MMSSNYRVREKRIHESKNEHNCGGSWQTTACLSAWVLGDMLMAFDFEEYAMRHVYNVYFLLPATSSITAPAVHFGFANTVETSKLLLFMIDYRVSHFRGVVQAI